MYLILTKETIYIQILIYMEMCSLNINKFIDGLIFINSLMAIANKPFVKSQLNLYILKFFLGVGWVGSILSKIFLIIGICYIYKAPKYLRAGIVLRYTLKY